MLRGVGTPIATVPSGIPMTLTQCYSVYIHSQQ